MKYYAVKDEYSKKVYTSWDEVKELLPTLTKPKYKSFKTLEEANAFLNDEVIKPYYDEPVCYIDGSFDVNTNNYSFGGVLIVDGKEYTFKKRYEADEYAQYRNVAGEIKGAGFIINYCINKGIKKLNIYYDYIGIEKWYKGEWKANSNIAIEYQKFQAYAKDKIEVVFHKVKSHTNNYYNDLADKLAKEALEL